MVMSFFAYIALLVEIVIPAEAVAKVAKLAVVALMNPLAGTHPEPAHPYVLSSSIDPGNTTEL